MLISCGGVVWWCGSSSSHTTPAKRVEDLGLTCHTVRQDITGHDQLPDLPP
jgi:hypothetical protein